ncbi:MFS general substrate transporter [Pseudovirgaria hyperparasitica]|uniref:MFS general substrate transporter n=1 Tax=Pseudovirgaria hyperparasitica TaxID=470096 RepID=A0A6A6WKE1_9PEZI|nr:MFS general substrate transporter [Pseudovirgaria hyperparasitica]KAF2762644.1 MFS general substrate transporter [Pseudovirgaria hyperparasitica]
MGSPNAVELKLRDQTNILPLKRLVIVYATLSLSLFICYADQNGIGVALPTIARDLDAGDTISWAGTSSLIANTVFQVLYGRLSDIFGRKVIYLSAIALLVVADVLCSIAPNAYAFYVFRGMAGVANGGINSLTMMIVSDVVTLKQRGKYQGILGACIGLGNTFGPLVSGAFAQYLTWRGFFWLLAPMGACCAVSGWFLVPSKPVEGHVMDKVKLIDWWGILTGTVAIILLLIPISGGGAYFEWTSPMVIVMLTIGAVALVAFLLVEAFISKLPMTPLSMFTITPVAVMLAQNLVFGMAYYSELYYLPLYFENVRGWSPIISASLTIPLVIAQAAMSALSGQYISWASRYGEVIWSGYAIWTLGAGLMILFDRNTSAVVIIFITLVTGLGVGNVFQPVLVALQAHAPRHQRAVIISNRNFLRSLGGAAGLAISAAILQSSLRGALPSELSYIAKNAYARPSLESFTESEREAIVDAYMTGLRTVFTWLVPLIGFCLLSCILVKDNGLEHRENDAKGPEAESRSSKSDEKV